MTHYLLGLGSNLQPERHLPLARSALTRIGKLLACSPVLDTHAVGETFRYPFQNQLVLVQSPLDGQSLKQELLKIEESLGREPKCDARKYKDRTIDIDILSSAPSSDDCLTQPLEDSYYRCVQQSWEDAG